MSETLIPTMSLRFVEREEPHFDAMTRIGGPPLVRTVRILQQLHTTPGGKPVWVDVPSVKDPA